MTNFDDFNSGSLGPFWASASNYSIEFAAGDGILSFDGGASLNLNPVTVGSGQSRQITTTPQNLSAGQPILFDLLIGNSASTPWGSFENADSGEDIILAYSIDGGASFVTIQRFDTEAGATFGKFGSFSVPVPVAAQTSSTILRWFQVRNSGTSFDHWALDNVEIGGIANRDFFATDDETSVNGNVFVDNGNGADDATNPPLTVTEVNGQPTSVGVQTTLPSGALLTLNANGSFTYIPTEDTPLGQVFSDEFFYTVEDSIGNTDIAKVSVEVSGLDNNDIIIGTPQADVLNGGAGNDNIDGLGGNDIIDGGLGDDVLDGNAGNDTASYAFASGQVTVDLNLQGGMQNTGAAGMDTLSNFENLLGSMFADTLIGDGLANVLEGNAGADVLRGNGGNDILRGGLDNDTLDGGLGSDNLFGGDGNDDLDGGLSADVLDGGKGDDDLDGGAGNDQLIGSFGKDALEGSFGDDTLMGGGGNDRMFGGYGNDTLDGGTGGDTADYSGFGGGTRVNLSLLGVAQDTGAGGIDTLFNIEHLQGGAYNDTLTGNGAFNIIQGGFGSDRIAGGDGNDRLFGNQGNDVIRGDAGDDTIDGGQGRDLLIGGAGNDTFLFRELIASQPGGIDRIDDFSIAPGINGKDFIDISDVSIGLNYIGYTAFNGVAGEVRVIAGVGGQSVDVVEVDLNGDGARDMVLHVDVYQGAGLLTSGDFIL